MKEDFTNATIKDSSYKYTPTVKKVITLSSSESESDSDSDIENIIKNNNFFIVIVSGKTALVRRYTEGKKIICNVLYL